jgi:DNA (cytosine-5)-methyltransferase 1
MSKIITIKKNKNKNKMKFIDLFSGIGGFHIALSKLGHKCVLACDIDKNCREIYEKNYGVKPCDDIRKIDENNMVNFDILCAGFPCQSFSNAGNKNAFEDKIRGTLFFDIIRIAKEKKPKFMFLENVKHIKKIDNGSVFNTILGALDEIGYHIEDEKQVFELSPHQLGIPQDRKRIIFVCIRKDIYDSSKVIDLDLDENIEIKFDNILETNVEEKYKVKPEIEQLFNIWDEMVKKMETGQKMSPTILCNEFHSNYTEEEFETLPQWKRDYITKNKPIYQKYKDLWDIWYGINKDILSKKEVNGKLEWQAGPLEENDSIWNHFIQVRQSGIRVKKNKFFPTLVAIVQTPIYGKEKRYITPRECARLQSFPDTFILPDKDNIAYKQFGNAVNVDVVYRVMSKTLELYK